MARVPYNSNGAWSSVKIQKIVNVQKIDCLQSILVSEPFPRRVYLGGLMNENQIKRGVTSPRSRSPTASGNGDVPALATRFGFQSSTHRGMPGGGNGLEGDPASFSFINPGVCPVMKISQNG